MYKIQSRFGKQKCHSAELVSLGLSPLQNVTWVDIFWKNWLSSPPCLASHLLLLFFPFFFFFWQEKSECSSRPQEAVIDFCPLAAAMGDPALLLYPLGSFVFIFLASHRCKSNCSCISDSCLIFLPAEVCTGMGLDENSSFWAGPNWQVENI